MESPGNICKMKALRENLTEKVSLRNIESVFLDNDAKNVGELFSDFVSK